MSNLIVKDALGATQTIKTTGDGSGGDPHVHHHNIDTVVPGTGATELGKAEDAAHASGDVGVQALAVRKDSATALAGTDGDYTPLITDANGRLYVNATGSGGTQYAEDAAHVSGDIGTLALGVRKDTAAATAGTDGDYQPMIFDANGRLHVTTAGGGGGSVQYTEDGASAGGESLSLAGAVRRDTAASSAGTDGDYATINTDANGRLWTNGIEEGDVAHDAADSGNPVKVGAQARTTNPTAVADADRANLISDKIGRLVTVPHQVRQLVTDDETTITASTSETTVLGAVGSTFLDVVCVIVSNSSASATLVSFRDTTGGAVRFNVYVPAGQTVGFVPAVPVTQASVNTNWTAQSSVSVTSLSVFIQAVKNI